MHRHRADAPPFLPGSTPPVRVRSGTDTLEFEELAPFVLDDTVTDVLVQGGVSVWVDRGTGLVDTGLRVDETRTRELATRLVALGGRHVDESTPIADVRHGDGIRVHVVLAPVAVRGTTLSIRLPRGAPPTIDSLTHSGVFARVPRRLVEDAVARRRNVLVSGATGSGKTTLLAAMLALVPHDERIVTVEDVAEASLSRAVKRTCPTVR